MVTFFNIKAHIDDSVDAADAGGLPNGRAAIGHRSNTCPHR